MSNKHSNDKHKKFIQKLKQKFGIRNKSTISIHSNQPYLEAIINNTETISFLKTADFKYMFVNREFQRFTRLSSEGQIAVLRELAYLRFGNVNATHHRQEKAERGTSGAFFCLSVCDC